MIITILGVLLTFVVVAFMTLISAVWALVVGWFIGLIASAFFGDLVCSGLALIGIVVAPNQLPLLFAILCLIGSFFKDPPESNKK